MSDVLKKMIDLLEFDNDTSDDLEEGVSQSVIEDITNTMVDNPRVRTRMKRIGIDLENSGVYANFVAAISPVLTMFIDSQGERVAGVSAAKKAIKDSIKVQREEVEHSEKTVLQEGDSIVWQPGVGFWTMNCNEMAGELKEHCGKLRDALVIVNQKLNNPTGLSSADVDRIKKAKERIIGMY